MGIDTERPDRLVTTGIFASLSGHYGRDFEEYRKRVRRYV